MPKIDIASVPERKGSLYPAPFHEMMHGRIRKALGDAGGLTQFGVNLMRLPPGQWSSQRHWHTDEDEFTYVLEGEAVLVTDAGEQVMRAGDCAGFPAGQANGHHFQNRSDREVVLLEVGSRRPETDLCYYPDVDMAMDPVTGDFIRKDGSATGARSVSR